MKFVALALALVLAVGSHAASLQADAPSRLEHIRSAMDLYMNQVKDSANKALSQLDDTEYAQLKAGLSQRIEELHSQVKALQGVVSPITDSVFNTLSDATADFRASFMADIDAMKTDLAPQRAKLREVIDRHIAEYRAQMDPIITEYYEKHTADMNALKAKLEPVMAELSTKVEANVEETKTALLPIVEAVRDKLTAHLETLKGMASPYVEEYKDKMVQTYSQASLNPDEMNKLKEKIIPLAEGLKTQLQTIFETIASSITKS